MQQSNSKPPALPPKPTTSPYADQFPSKRNVSEIYNFSPSVASLEIDYGLICRTFCYSLGRRLVEIRGIMYP